MKNYKFEFGDVRAFITVVNVMLIMRYGLTVAWFGLAVAGIGLLIDFGNYIRYPERFRVNSTVMHLSNIVLNVYFMCGV